MKYTWTEQDIICGRIVCKPPTAVAEGKKFEPDGWTAKWTFKLGYECSSSAFVSLLQIIQKRGCVVD